jgi:alkylmercury lyase
MLPPASASSVPSEELHALAEAVAGTFPARDDAPLARALLRELAQGRPVPIAELDRGARATVARWPNVEYDDEGRVVAFAGLSLTPTAHRFTIDGHVLHTWCAWDTLFLPALLDRSATVRSRCPITRTEVRLHVAPTGIVDSDPTALRVSFPPPNTTSTADITGTFCCHVHFLAGPTAADQWLSRHPGGLALALDDAYELGRLATHCCAG